MNRRQQVSWHKERRKGSKGYARHSYNNSFNYAMTEPRDSHEPTQKYFDSSIPTGSVSDIMIYDRAMHIY